MPAVEGHYVITTSGSDGIVCAALFALKYPEVQVLLASRYSIHDVLNRLCQEFPPGLVHITGVGYSENEREICRALLLLQSKGSRCRWYCARGYLDRLQEEMAASGCQTLFEQAESNAAGVARQLQLDKQSGVAMLLRLARQFADKKKGRSNDEQFWHHYIEYAYRHMLDCGDDSLVQQAIRQLAGRSEVTERDRLRVQHFRKRQDLGRPNVGNSKQMRRVRNQVQQFCSLCEPVLIMGPTGSGKEAVAHSLHQAGNRGKDGEGPFVAINCGAISRDDNTALDHLFGHVPGAFTGAAQSRLGAFQQARGGTLFLDEVGDLPTQAQVQLLRAIETRRVLPLGANEEVAVDVRLVCATHRHLAKMVQQQQFREDLLFRLMVLVIQVPPLRERREDIKPILDASDWEWETTPQVRQEVLSKADWEAINAYDWPGNVRQLKNVYRRACLLGITMRASLQLEREYLESSCTDEPVQVEPLLPTTEADVRPLEDLQRVYFQHVWQMVGGSTGRASKLLGVTPNTVRKYLKVQS